MQRRPGCHHGVASPQLLSLFDERHLIPSKCSSDSCFYLVRLMTDDYMNSFGFE